MANQIGRDAIIQLDGAQRLVHCLDRFARPHDHLAPRQPISNIAWSGARCIWRAWNLLQLMVAAASGAMISPGPQIAPSASSAEVPAIFWDLKNSESVLMRNNHVRHPLTTCRH